MWFMAFFDGELNPNQSWMRNKTQTLRRNKVMIYCPEMDGTAFFLNSNWNWYIYISPVDWHFSEGYTYSLIAGFRRVYFINTHTHTDIPVHSEQVCKCTMSKSGRILINHVVSSMRWNSHSATIHFHYQVIKCEIQQMFSHVICRLLQL